jgi:hypothetical protein
MLLIIEFLHGSRGEYAFTKGFHKECNSHSIVAFDIVGDD